MSKTYKAPETQWGIMISNWHGQPNNPTWRDCIIAKTKK